MRFLWLSVAVWGIVDLIFYFRVVQVILFWSDGGGEKYKILFVYIILIRLSPKGLVLPFRRLLCFFSFFYCWLNLDVYRYF